MNEKFLSFLAERYATIKARFPAEGRRKWHLRILQEFWCHRNDESLELPPPVSEDNFLDPDPLDALLDGSESGILVRTDYSDEQAWQAFCDQLTLSENELAETLKPDPSDITQANVDMEDGKSSDGESESDMSTDDQPFPLVKIISAASSEQQAVYNNASNLKILRLFNDVDVRPSPAPVAGTPRISAPNPLIDQKGWQEIYAGKTIWIYDSKSNADQCARLVHSAGDIYGTATGDSWRAKVTHVPELQFNMTFMGMSINFGGLDRWDYDERRRNLNEAHVL